MCFLHGSKPFSVDNVRRGIVVFFRKELKFQLSKVYASNKFDIVWMRLESDREAVHVCFFYATGDPHPLPIRKKFYDIFTSKFSQFASLGRVYLIGDTNARLGSVLGDKNINGKFVTNPYTPLFMEFLEFSGATILNKIFCPGLPTYEFVNKKRSIIDMYLTNSLKSAVNFGIEPTPLGMNSQTCHKPLNTYFIMPHW